MKAEEKEKLLVDFAEWILENVIGKAPHGKWYVIDRGKMTLGELYDNYTITKDILN